MNSRRWMVAGGVVAGLAAAFVLGRWSAPRPELLLEEIGTEAAKVEVVEVYGHAEEWVTRRDTDHQRDEVRVVYRERLPDGTERSMETTTTSDRILEEARGQGARSEQVVKVETVEVARIVERRVEVHTAPPDWRLSALVGLEVKDGAPTYGAAFSRRVFGPVELGAWGISSGTGGLSVGVTW